MEAIDGFFETVAHLDFIDHDKVLVVFEPMCFDVIMELVVFLKMLESDVVEVDMDDVGVGDGLGDVGDETRKQHGFTAAPNPGDNFDVGSAHDFL